jgi:signal transduction histidine kinase
MPDGFDTGRTPGGLSREELAMLTHELRGALTVISGYSEFLRRPLPDDERTHALDGIGRAIRRIDGLLDSAAEGRPPERDPKTPVNLAELAESVADEQRTLSLRDVTVSVEGDPVVLGTSEALERALGNLIGNSLKYSLSSSAVEVRVSEAAGRGILAVADRGPGIPEPDRERVLRPFERLDAHESVPGTGLGLTVVQSVAQAHGGDVEILDRPGGGAIVRIELPLANA